MQKFIEQMDYIKNQLTYIKSKVELDNQLGLFDINKLGENIFMHILNDVYDWNLTNANLIQENFPAIDLVDAKNKLVIQVTSTVTADKLRNTIDKFKKLEQYSDYKLKIFYIKDKPNFQKNILDEFSKNGVTSNDILGIEDILDVIQSDHNKCQALYLTIQQRLDSISFSFNVDSYFNKSEPQLVDTTTNNFKVYEEQFLYFINSSDKLLEIYASGGSGKSHLLKHLSTLKTNYIPLIFTKQVNIEEDLKKLSSDKSYLLIFDDIDRFLDTNILINLLSYTLIKENCKLIITYRTASKNLINSVSRKYNKVCKQEIEIIWTKENIVELIKSLSISISDNQIEQLVHAFNNNPYLINQAIKGNVSTIKEFSNKIIDDAKTGLLDFGLTDIEINDLLFELALIAPISINDIKKYFPAQIQIIEKLEDIKVLRKLSSKYRFNPDIQGDMFIGFYIENYQKNFEEKIESILPFFSQTVFTNLSYALAYTSSETLTDFIKRIIINWTEQNLYDENYIASVSRIVSYAPMESFVYLERITKYITDFGNIEPIISRLINLLKNETVEDLQIKHIINYLSSDKVLSLPKPYYDNQTLSSIFKKIVSPLNTINFDVIIEALVIMQNWMEEIPLNTIKLKLLKESIQSLLCATFDNNYSDGFTYYYGQVPINTKHPDILKIFDKVKSILLKMITSNNNQILSIGIDSISKIGGYHINMLSSDNQEYYSEFKIIFLKELVELVNNNQEFYILSKIDKLATNILKFDSEKYEALSILKAINRSDEFLMYQIVMGVDIIIIDFDNFYKEYIKQSNIKDWMFNSILRNDKYQLSDDEQNIIKRLSYKYIDEEELLDLLNKLDTYEWNSYRTLLGILHLWYDENKTTITILCKKHLDRKIIKSDITFNALKELALYKEILEINEDDITIETSNEDLKVYINYIFKNYSRIKLRTLNKIIEVIQNKDEQDIRMFISTISQDIYFAINSNLELFEDFKHIIINFFDLQLKYKFNVESYLTHHIMKDIKPQYGIPDDIKDRLIKIINDEDIYIQEFDLGSIYKILEIDLDSLLEIIFKKLTSKRVDGKYRYIFSHYFKYNEISETLLVKKYINQYSDFSHLINKTLEYFNSFSQIVKDKKGEKRVLRIDIDYFIEDAISKENLELLFEELIENKDIEKIKLLYTIVPISGEYFNLIVRNINILQNYVSEEKLINYLTQVGKIKSYSRSLLHNSIEITKEEQLLQEIYDSIDSLSLKLRIKDELKYIQNRKKREIESDIEHLLDK